MIEQRRLLEKFAEIYGGSPRIFRAPGRVNLIGEHTDYNGGFVLPMAIDKQTIVAAAPRNDRKICVFSVNFEEFAEFDLDAASKIINGFWLNYVEGMARILEQQDFRLKGADLLIWSNVPTGAGLSSSAALETAIGLALTEISNNPIDRVTLAKAGQQTEHDYVGAKVGIMDQFVSANAKAGCALLLDCRSLEFENVPLDTKEVAVVICDTNVTHDLASSEYNTRREECETGVKILKKFLPEIKQLRDVGLKDFEKYKSELPETVMCRCRHILTENERVLKAAEALKKNDLTAFGNLMWQSHESLKTDYEVSCEELDLMVEIAKDTNGVLGGRMTGGGFGGSTVNLVKRENLGRFKEKIRKDYQRLSGIKPTILVSEASGGASEIAIDV